MARYKDDIGSYINNRVSILDVVGASVNLKKRGRNYTGLCPFHSEKTASFTVSSDKQFYHCFGCGKSGDSIAFIMETENLGFIEAIEYLADRYNIDLSPMIVDSGYKSRDTKVLYEIMVNSARYYYENIKANKQAFYYLNNRGISTETIVKFGIGFAKDSWEDLYKYLKNMGFKEEDIVECGLIKPRNNSKGYYDVFRNRIIFPIFDRRGRVIAFGGRVIHDEMPKYLNSPETVIFNKSKTLYSLNFALKNKKNDTLVLVEGYLDVIALHQKGFTNCVATLGTALNIEHIKEIKKFYKELIFAFDADRAGREAINRSLHLFENSQIKVRVLELGDYKDPDEFVSKAGPDAFRLQLENAISDIDFRIKHIMKEYDLNDSHDRLSFLKQVYKIIEKLNSNVERELYFERLASITRLDETAIKNDYKISSNVQKQTTSNDNKFSVSKDNSQEANLFEKKSENKKPEDDNPLVLVDNIERYLLKYYLCSQEYRDYIDSNIKISFLISKNQEVLDILKEYFRSNETYVLEYFISILELNQLEHIETIDKINIVMDMDNLQNLIKEHRLSYYDYKIYLLDVELTSLQLNMEEGSAEEYRQKMIKRVEYAKMRNDLRKKRYS